MKISRVLIYLILASFTLGFKVFGPKWPITRDSPTVWIKFKEDDLERGFLSYPTNWEYGSYSQLDPTMQRRALIRAMFDEYHAIDTSFARLAFYPIDGVIDASDDPADTPFDPITALNRTITISMAPAGGPLTAGYAYPQSSGSDIIACTIVIAESTFLNPVEFFSTLGHEVGHCMGLMHNHSDTGALMGYNSRGYKLGVDDQMAITYLYPRKPEYGKEAATLGLACEKSK